MPRTHHTKIPTEPVPPVVMVIDTANELDGLDEAGAFHVDAQLGRRDSIEYSVDDIALDDDELDTRTTAEHDTGDLYGVATQQAVDSTLTASEAEDGFVGAENGQNWFEALSASASENGACPEKPIDVEDELTSPSASHSSKDRPVADAGAGGPGGR